MSEYQHELNLEKKHLEEVVDLIQQQLAKLRHSQGKGRGELVDSREEMWDDITHAADEFDRVIELTQFYQQLSRQTDSLQEEAEKLRSLERMLDVPFFARIDFRLAGTKAFLPSYIGRASLMDDQSKRIHVFDWRAPIASVFYRYETGAVQYQAPRGTIQGEVNLKRQYEIAHGKLKYFFDADVQINDEFLRRLLGENTSPQMRAIVETIQRDQDIVIRDLDNELLMVQGAAGSGKTSVALHRVAYLMYQGLETRLSAHHIVILSPNRLFEQYIGNVLPELGESRVQSLGFEELAAPLLREGAGARVTRQNWHQSLEELMECRDEPRRQFLQESYGFKTSETLTEILRRFCKVIPRRYLSFTDVEYAGTSIAGRFELKNRICNDKSGLPLALQLQHLEQRLLDRVHELRPRRHQYFEEWVSAQPNHAFDALEYARLLSIYESTRLIQQIHRFTHFDSLHLYRALLQDELLLRRLAAGLPLPESLSDMLKRSCEAIDNGQLLYEDSVALSYLHLLLHGNGLHNDIRQVVVDEVQDYEPMHFRIMQMLFPRARFTVLGDINQTIAKQEDMQLFSMLPCLLAKERSLLMTMTKSFRCTQEILDFSSRFLDDPSLIESFSRHGESPTLHKMESRRQMLEAMLAEAKRSFQQGYRSIGVICKSARHAQELHQELQALPAASPPRLVDENLSISDFQGCMVLPIYMAKGLEFDTVLIADVDKEHYNSDNDRKLLYVASTRALHRLHLFACEEPSLWLGQEGGDANDC